MNDIITKLKNEGVLKFYVDFRYGTFKDRIAGLEPTITGSPRFTGNGCRFDGSTDKLTYSNSIFSATTLTMICLADFLDTNHPLNYPEVANIFSAPATNRAEFRVAKSLTGASSIVFAGVGCSSYDLRGKKSIALSHQSGGAVSFYCDGTLVSTSGVLTLTAGDSLAVGAWSGNGYNFNQNMKALLFFNRVLTATEHSQVYAQLSSMKPEKRVINISRPSLDGPKSGLVGHWKLDDIVGVTAPDSSGNGYNGTLTGGPVLENTSMGRAVRFGGGMGKRITNNLTNFNSSIPWSLCFWINQSTVTAQQHIFGIGNGPVGISTSAVGLLVFRIYDNPYTTYTLNDLTTSLKQWTHIGLSVDGSNNISVYKNGVFQSTVGVTNSKFYPTNIGGTTRDIDNNLNGLIKDVRIYNRALSAVEVASLYERGKKALSQTMFGTRVSTGNET